MVDKSAEIQQVNATLYDTGFKLKSALEEYQKNLESLKELQAEIELAQAELSSLHNQIHASKEHIQVYSDMNESRSELEASIHQLEEVGQETKKQLIEEMDYYALQLHKDKDQIAILATDKKELGIVLQKYESQQQISSSFC